MNRWYDFDDYLADDLYSEDDIAFEKMSEEFLAGIRPLKNQRGSCSTPHAKGGKGSGDGTCYQVHQDYGEANSGEDGSPQRAEYMKEYRKKYYKNRADGARDGLDSRTIVPKPYPRNKPPKEGIGKHDRSRKRASLGVLSRVASEERYALLKMAYENPILRGEVFEILSKKNTKVAFRKAPAPRIKRLKNPRQKGCNSFMVFKDWKDKDYEKYVDELIKGYPNAVFGQCYQTHNDYGAWGGNSRSSDKAYQDWYNNNVRQRKDGEYLGPKDGKNRSKDNRRSMVEKYFKHLSDPNIKSNIRQHFFNRLRNDPSGVPQEILENLGLVKDKNNKVVDKKTKGGVSMAELQKRLQGLGGGSAPKPSAPKPESKPSAPKPESKPSAPKSESKPSAPKSESKPQQSRRERARGRAVMKVDD